MFNTPYINLKLELFVHVLIYENTAQRQIHLLAYDLLYDCRGVQGRDLEGSRHGGADSGSHGTRRRERERRLSIWTQLRRQPRLQRINACAKLKRTSSNECVPCVGIEL
jgi:hypothetical protein